MNSNSPLAKGGFPTLIGTIIGGTLMLQPITALSQGMTVRCLSGSSSNTRACNIDIFNSVLEGKYGNLVRLRFNDGNTVEAFCLDAESKDCWVRTRHSQWERGRIRWAKNYPGFNAAFFIENKDGLTLGAYDAPPAY
jgi:hypothetical protein